MAGRKTVRKHSANASKMPVGKSSRKKSAATKAAPTKAGKKSSSSAGQRQRKAS